MSILFRSTNSGNTVPNLPGRDGKGCVYSNEPVASDLFSDLYSLQQGISDYRCVALVNSEPFPLSLQFWMEPVDPFVVTVKQDIPSRVGFVIRPDDPPAAPCGYLRVVDGQEALFYVFTDGLLHVLAEHRGLLGTQSGVIAAWDRLEYIPPILAGWQREPLSCIRSYTDLPPPPCRLVSKAAPLNIPDVPPYGSVGVWLNRCYPKSDYVSSNPVSLKVRMYASFSHYE